MRDIALCLDARWSGQNGLPASFIVASSDRQPISWLTSSALAVHLLLRRGTRFLQGTFCKSVTNIPGMFDMSADDTGWIITLIVAVALLAIVVGAGWLWR
jgi:hypothetical protein